MRQRAKADTRTADDEPVIQLTRGQMVAAVCGLMIGALFFYLLGVVTSRLEPMISENQAQQQASHVLPAPDAPGTPSPATGGERSSSVRPEGIQATPRTDVVPLAKKESQPAQSLTATPPQGPNADDSPPLSRVPAPAETSTTTAAQLETAKEQKPKTASSGPKPVELTPKPPTEASAVSSPDKTQDRPETTETAKETSAEQTQPVPAGSEKKPQAGADSAAKSEKEPSFTLEKMEVPPETTQPAAAASGTAAGPFYSIQLIAFSKANRAKAEAYAKEVRENAGLDVELESSTDGEYIRVFVGRYADRESALKACRELQKQERFSKIFVPQEARRGTQ